MTKPFKPMQPNHAELDKVTYPVLAQKKWDGMKLIIRTIGSSQIEFLGRSLKPIKNRWVIEQLSPLIEKAAAHGPVMLEGELQANGSFEGSDGLVSAHYREFDSLIFHVFDCPLDPEEDFIKRNARAGNIVKVIDSPMVQMVETTRVLNENELMDLCGINSANPSLDGTIIRRANMGYKYGRSRPSGGEALKIKNEADGEVTVVGFEEMMHNKNEKKTNELGRSERSTSKEGLVPAGMLGALVCVFDGPEGEKQVKLGTGFSMAQRQKYWDNRSGLMGSIAVIKYMRLTKYGVPLHPVFHGFRSDIDLPSKEEE